MLFAQSFPPLQPYRSLPVYPLCFVTALLNGSHPPPANCHPMCGCVVVYHTLEPRLVMQQAYPPTAPRHPLELPAAWKEDFLSGQE